MRARPELSDFFSAIDGIKKPDRNHRETDCNTSGEMYTRYDPAQDAVRPDVLKILLLEESQFVDWFNRRWKAVNRELKRLKLMGSIPALYYGVEQYTLGEANTDLKNRLELAEKMKKSLELILERRVEMSNGSRVQKLA